MSSNNQPKEYRCYVTDEVIPQARVEYLLSEGVPEHMLTSLTGSTMVHRPRKMLILDDESNYVICDKIDETRVYAAERFGKVSEEEEEDKIDDDLEPKSFKVITKEKEEDDL